MKKASHWTTFWLSICFLLREVFSSFMGHNMGGPPTFKFPLESTTKVIEGETVFLDCEVLRKAQKTVSWVRYNADHIELLTYGTYSFHEDKRFSSSYQHPQNWRLRITGVRRSDEGLYECQISTYPPMKKRVHLRITDPVISIVNAKGASITEAYVKEGSSLDLRCFFTTNSGLESHIPIIWRKNGIRLSQQRGILWEEMVRDRREVSSWLHVQKAKEGHSGEYQCATDNAKPRAVRILVIKEEIFAAIHPQSSAAQSSRQSISMFILFLLILMHGLK